MEIIKLSSQEEPNKPYLIDREEFKRYSMDDLRLFCSQLVSGRFGQSRLQSNITDLYGTYTTDRLETLMSTLKSERILVNKELNTRIESFKNNEQPRFLKINLITPDSIEIAREYHSLLCTYIDLVTDVLNAIADRFTIEKIKMTGVAANHLLIN